MLHRILPVLNLSLIFRNKNQILTRMFGEFDLFQNGADYWHHHGSGGGVAHPHGQEPAREHDTQHQPRMKHNTENKNKSNKRQK